jgi:hypothetical protein
MLTGSEIRARVRYGLSTGRLWRLTDDRAKLHRAMGEDPVCHACSEPIARGQAFRLARASAVVLVHLECYMFWLHACGLLEREPTVCATCRRLIPPHAERALVNGALHHTRCRDRMGGPESSVDLAVPRGPGDRR